MNKFKAKRNAMAILRAEIARLEALGVQGEAAAAARAELIAGFKAQLAKLESK